MKLRISTLFFAATAILPIAGGCSARLQETTEKTVAQTAGERFDLAAALASARRKQLDVQTYEALQLLAAEYKENRMRLQLSGAISDLRSGSLPPDFILNALDNALSYNYLVGMVSQTDLEVIQRVRTSQLLDLAVASAIARLEAEYQLSLAGADNETALREQEMEVRILTGASPIQIARFDASALPRPIPLRFDREALRQFAAFTRPESRGSALGSGLPEEAKRLFDGDRAFPLLYARALYRFPSLLESRRILQPQRDWAKVARLANAVGIALQIDRDFEAVNRAYETFRLLELKSQLAEKNGSLSSSLRISLIRSRQSWQLAWFRLRTDLGIGDFEVKIPDFQTVPHPEFTEDNAAWVELLSAAKAEK